MPFPDNDIIGETQRVDIHMEIDSQLHRRKTVGCDYSSIHQWFN